MLYFLRAYGETIENRIKEHCIITGVSVMPEGETATRMLEDFADRDGLFAVFVNAQNEVHRSLTLNILHGTPQGRSSKCLLLEAACHKCIET